MKKKKEPKYWFYGDTVQDQDGRPLGVIEHDHKNRVIIAYDGFDGFYVVLRPKNKRKDCIQFYVYFAADNLSWAFEEYIKLINDGHVFPPSAMLYLRSS